MQKGCITQHLFRFHISAAKKARQKYVMQVHQTSGNEAAYRAGFGTRWRDMPAALKVKIVVLQLLK